jgi:hypothetical protein
MDTCTSKERKEELARLEKEKERKNSEKGECVLTALSVLN